MIKDFLNPKGHQNPISGSKVTVILLKGWILQAERILGYLAMSGASSSSPVILVANKTDLVSAG